MCGWMNDGGHARPFSLLFWTEEIARPGLSVSAEWDLLPINPSVRNRLALKHSVPIPNAAFMQPQASVGRCLRGPNRIPKGLSSHYDGPSSGRRHVSISHREESNLLLPGNFGIETRSMRRGRPPDRQLITYLFVGLMSQGSRGYEMRHTYSDLERAKKQLRTVGWGDGEKQTLGIWDSLPTQRVAFTTRTAYKKHQQFPLESRFDPHAHGTIFAARRILCANEANFVTSTASTICGTDPWGDAMPYSEDTRLRSSVFGLITYLGTMGHSSSKSRLPAQKKGRGAPVRRKVPSDNPRNRLKKSGRVWAEQWRSQPCKSGSAVVTIARVFITTEFERKSGVVPGPISLSSSSQALRAFGGSDSCVVLRIIGRRIRWKGHVQPVVVPFDRPRIAPYQAEQGRYFMLVV
ncbi:hypothetical protein DFH06DRAFT_1128745 [Mycena polygramma]|nr:hypothetical protein DFH06DRAFT_1128745 [Mycena polygramma]